MVRKLTSKENINVKYAVRISTDTNFRKKENQFIVEGLRLCKDAVLSNAVITKVFITEEMSLKYKEIYNMIETKCNDIFLVTNDVLKKISTTENPQGIIFICSRKENSELIFNKNMILLENIQNPLNMGTILRTAEAFGIDDVIITKNSCDVYSPKVVRGSMGAIFRLNILCDQNVEDILRDCNKKGIVTCATSPNKNAQNILDINFKKGYYLMVIGNEANGLSKKAFDLCKKKVTIPMSGRAESLNASVSATVLIWEMTKSLT